MSMGYVVLLLVLFGLFVVIPSEIFGTARVFLWADDKFLSFPAFVRFLIAWLLSVASYMTGLTIIIGIIEIFRQWKRYIKRKHQQFVDTANESIWQEVLRNDRRKLIYAYLIWPFHEVRLDYRMLSGIYRQIYPTLSDYASLIVASLVIMLGDFMLMLAPTSIRFLIIRRKLNYGTEICGYIVLSLFLSLCMNFYSTGNMVSSLGIMYTFATYCILSYQSSEYSDEWYSMKISPILLIIVGLSGISLFSWMVINSGRYVPARSALNIANEGQYIPIREAMVIGCTWLMSKEHFAHRETEQHYEANQQKTHREPPEGTHVTFNNEPPDVPTLLVDTAIAHIGRITPYENPYISPELTQARHYIERPFLRMLSERYHNKDTHKILARHFMLYKEMTLFVIFAMLLGNNNTLHSLVRTKLKERLSDGLSDAVIKKRNELWRTMSEKFYESYSRTHDLATTLEYVFWNTLPENVKQYGFADLDENGYLMRIFNFTKDALKDEEHKIQPPV